jgi:hypothetical protein
MTHKTTAILITTLTLLGAGPAKAFCIENKTPYALRIHLETFSSYDRFAVLFKPGDISCCHWLTKRCNPTGERDGFLSFSVRAKTASKRKPYCADGWSKRIVATASGKISITERPGTIGGLHCDSRDIFNRPVSKQSTLRRSYKGLPPPIVVPPPPE